MTARCSSRITCISSLHVSLVTHCAWHITPLQMRYCPLLTVSHLLLHNDSCWCCHCHVPAATCHSSLLACQVAALVFTPTLILSISLSK
jgi:hypothetical protein